MIGGGAVRWRWSSEHCTGALHLGGATHLSPLADRLLPGHDAAHFGFTILDDLAADVEGHTVERPGEFEGRCVERRYRRPGIGADGDTACQAQGKRRCMGKCSLPNEFTVDIELGAARRSLAISNIRRAGPPFRGKKPKKTKPSELNPDTETAPTTDEGPGRGITEIPCF